jgi:alkylation response protein AidB-like acyl-CoA dehydrogenase
MHSGYGYTEEFAVEQYFPESKLLTVGEGTYDIQRLVVAHRLLEHDTI